MKKHSFSGMFALVTFGIFCVCIIIVLITGADSYKSLNGTNDRAYTERTAVQYIATKLHENDVQGRISVVEAKDENGSYGDAILIRETVEGDKYVTAIYCYNGNLMENYTYLESDDDIVWGDGSSIIEAEKLEADLSDSGLLTVKLSLEDGSNPEIKVSLMTEVHDEI